MSIAHSKTRAETLIETSEPTPEAAPVFNPGPPIPVMYFENGTPTPVANAASLTDSDSPDFDTGSLTVSAVNATAFDQLSVRNQGSGAGQIGFSGNQVSYGSVTIGTASGGANGASLSIAFNANASVAAVEALVKNVTFASTDEALQTGARFFNLVVNDGDGESAQIQTHIQAFGVNDAPVLANLDGDVVQFSQGAAPIRLDAGGNAALSDVDSPDFSGGSLTLSIASGKIASEDVLGIAAGGTVTVSGNAVSVGGVGIGTFSGGGAGGADLVFAFNGSATLARVATLVQNLTYWNSSGAPTLGARGLSVTLHDGDGTSSGGADSATAATQVQIVPGTPPTGGPPSFSPGGHSPMEYIEGAVFPVQIDREATLTDADSPDFNGGSLSVSLAGAGAGDQISIINGNGVSRSGSNVLVNGVAIGTFSGGSNGSPLVVAFNASATPAAAELLVKQLGYLTTSDAPTGGLASFTLVINDGDGNIAQIASNVQVTPVNDAPVISNLFGDFTQFTTGGGPVLLDTGTAASAGDVDSTNFGPGGLTVSITAGKAVSEDVLGLAAGTGVTMSGGQLIVDGIAIGTVLNGGGAGANDLSFLFNSDATQARVGKVLHALTYWNSDSTPTDALKTITVTLEDGGGTNNGGVDTTSAAAQVQVGQAVIPARFTIASAQSADMVMSPDGSRIYESGNDGYVRVYSASTGAALASWHVGNHLGAIDLSPDGSYLMVVERQLVGSDAGISSTITAYRVDTATGAVTSYPTVVPGDNGAFWDVSILAGGRVLFPGPFNGTQQVKPHILDLATGTYTVSNSDYGNTTSVVTSADRSQILLAPGGSSYLYLVGAGADDKVVELHENHLDSGANNGMQAIATAAGYIAQIAGGAWLYDLALGSRFEINQGGTLFGTAAAVAFDPDGEFLFVLDAANKQIRQISLADFNVVRSISTVDTIDQPWAVNASFVTYASRLQLTGDLGRFAIETGHSLLRIDAAMPSMHLTGDANANHLDGSIGDDVLDGGGGADVMAGGHGDDIYYVDNPGDVVVEEAHKGPHDAVYASISYALSAAADVEYLATADVNGTAAIDLTGSDSANAIYGNAGANVLSGAGGGDYLVGLDGADTLNGGAGGDALDGGAGNDALHGDADNDYLVGGAGNDALDGGTGADRMLGGLGDDVYVVDNAGDQVIEAAGEGFDSLTSSVSFILAAGSEIELLQTSNAAGTTAINLTGSDSVNSLYGNEGANVLSGAGGNDYVVGLGGGDTLYGDAGEDALDGGAGDDLLLGGAGNDYLVGGAGNDLLAGEAGLDRMFGGTGNDSYFVDNEGDQVTENAGEGFDRVTASADFTLSAGSEIELLQTSDFAGTAALHLTGSDTANSIYGNEGDNVLSGAGGGDYLVGLGGGDTLYGDAGEDALDGGTGDDLLLGGADNDYLVGGAGNDLLVGEAGADRMFGGTGNDSYFVDNAGDVVGETAGEGFDKVTTSVDFTLSSGSEIELLQTSDAAGTAPLHLTGSDTANSIYGNEGANVLSGAGGGDYLVGLGGGDTLYGDAGEDAIDGGAGDDNLNGGADSDYLVGGAGSDYFAFSDVLGPANIDRIADFSHGADHIALDDAVFTGLAPGALAASAFVAGTAAQDADDRIIYDSTTGALYFDADGNGAGAAVQFATLVGAPANLTASDFIVY